jgi:hypothetical protein
MKSTNKVLKSLVVVVSAMTLSFNGEANAQRAKNLGQVLPAPVENPIWVIPKSTPTPKPTPQILPPPVENPIWFPRATPTPTPKPTPKPPRPLPNPPKPPVPPTPAPIPAYFKINLNHQEQEYMLCVPTSASIMLNKFGWNYPPRQIKLATMRLPWYGPSTPFNHWTPMGLGALLDGLDYLGIKNWRIGWYSQDEYQRGLDELKASIRQGNPVMIIVSYGGPVAHAMAVCGYDDVNKRLIINDPGARTPGVVYYSYDDLKNKNWLTWGYRFLIYMNQQTTTSGVMSMLAPMPSEVRKAINNMPIN